MKITIRSSKSSTYIFMLFCIFIAYSSVPIQVSAGEVQAFREYQGKSLQTIKTQYDDLKAKYPDDTELKKFDQRIEVIDEIAVKIIKQFESVKLNALQNMISIGNGSSVAKNVTYS